MIVLLAFLTLWPRLGLSENGTSVHYVKENERDVLCASKICINKCCQQGEYLNCDNGTCVCNKTDVDFDFSTIPLHSDQAYGEKVDTKFNEAFVVLQSFFHNASDNFRAIAFPTSELAPKLIAYIGVDGKIQLDNCNAFKRWDIYETDKYCVDFVDDGNFTYYDTLIMHRDPPGVDNRQYVYAMFVSSFFLMLVLVVYTVLPELRNLPGKILMAYVFSQIIAFISLCMMQVMPEMPPSSCVIITAIIYDSFLSSFCWMNVMSYDIFWTFRSYAKAREHRHGENFKFTMYCIYAWGVPLALTIMMLMMHMADFSDKPWIIKPLINDRGCFLMEGQKFVYLYAPMLILIISNWVFFLLTVFNIWRVGRATAVVRSPASGNAAAHRAHKFSTQQYWLADTLAIDTHPARMASLSGVGTDLLTVNVTVTSLLSLVARALEIVYYIRFILYIKLSVIMGVNWLLEVISSFYPELNGWWIVDMYNLLVGFSIFMIFVFRRKIYKDLQSKFSSVRLSRWSTTNSTSTSTTESNLSQDISLQVSQHPRGYSRDKN